MQYPPLFFLPLLTAFAVELVEERGSFEDAGFDTDIFEVGGTAFFAAGLDSCSRDVTSGTF